MPISLSRCAEDSTAVIRAVQYPSLAFVHCTHSSLKGLLQNRPISDREIHSWDDWVPQERLRKLTEENKELASNLKKDMDAQRRATTGKPLPTSVKKRAYGSDLTGSSARGSEDRSSAVPQAPRGTKRGREIEGIDKVSLFC